MFAGEGSARSGRAALLAGVAELDRGYGRFMQPDPLGYADGLNWYAYVGGDPVNGADPTGTQCSGTPATTGLPAGEDTKPCMTFPDDVVVNGHRLATGFFMGGSTGYSAVGAMAGGAAAAGAVQPPKVDYFNPSAPPNSKQCFAGGRGFRAPNDFDPNTIIKAGQTQGLSGLRSNVWQFGTYDFQRQTRDGKTTFYRQYTAVSNLAVGFYTLGAGLSRGQANAISDTAAFFGSKNGATPEQDVFRNLAYDVQEGKAKIVCYK